MVHSAWRESPFACVFNYKRMLSNCESIYETANCNISEGHTGTKRQTKIYRNDSKPLAGSGLKLFQEIFLEVQCNFKTQSLQDKKS